MIKLDQETAKHLINKIDILIELIKTNEEKKKLKNNIK
jgi:hypothetical protein